MIDMRTERERKLDERDQKIKKKYERYVAAGATDNRAFVKLGQEFNLSRVHIRRIIANGNRQY